MTVTSYVPADAVPAPIVNVDVCVPEIEAPLRLTDRPEVPALAERLTVPVKLPEGVMLMVLVAAVVEPWVTETLDGEADKVKLAEAELSRPISPRRVPMPVANSQQPAARCPPAEPAVTS